uniref:glycogenin glucosyltransferase n=1 Tax=Lates calcarifer TaxID=8187 RepID=A0A4W6DZQ3_LATCA
MTRKMWGLIPVLDCSQLLRLCPSQCKPSVLPITASDPRADSAHRTMTDQAFVTLATNDSYAKGAMVLGQSLRDHNTTKKLVALVGPHVAEPCRDALRSIFDEVCVVDVMDSGDAAHLALMKRPDLGVTFTKLHCWTLTHYSKCVFMDADTLVLSNIDELFEREELSAAPDPGWPDCFNSGVFVFRPSNETHEKLLTFCGENGSFDGGDQGVLNSYFNTWATADISKHLPFIYNLSSIAIYSYLPAFKQYGHDAKVVHFLGKVKPWNYTYRCSEGRGQRSLPVARTVPPTPGLPAHVVAAVCQICAAFTAAGLQGHTLQQRLRRGERERTSAITVLGACGNENSLVLRCGCGGHA